MSNWLKIYSKRYALHAFLFLGELLATVIKKNIQYKLMGKGDILISLDRLTRFKNPVDKYFRVYTDILTKFLVSPKLSKKQIDLLEADELNKYVEIIWNNSVFEIYGKCNSDRLFNVIKIINESVFKVENSYTKKLMSAKLNIDSVIGTISGDYELPQNLILLKKLAKYDFALKEDKDLINKKALELRNRFKLKFPISKLVLVEGITEEILLPKFAKILDYDFDKNGVFVMGAGGKSKVMQLYYKFKDTLKVPVIILLDNDAMPIFEQIKKNLKRKDKAMLIQKGEFEDILPLNLIKRTINNSFYDVEKVKLSDFKAQTSICELLNDIYKSRGIGVFQKAHFAQNAADTIKDSKDASPEIEDIINYIAASNESIHLDSFLI